MDFYEASLRKTNKDFFVENIKDFKTVADNINKSVGLAKGSWVRFLPYVFIIIGLTLGFFSLAVGSLNSEGFGSNAFTLNPHLTPGNPPTPPPQVADNHIQAYSNVKFQIWNLRAAQYANAAVVLDLPDPTTMANGSLIIARNVSSRIPSGSSSFPPIIGGDVTLDVPQYIKVNEVYGVASEATIYNYCSGANQVNDNEFPYFTYVVWNGKFYKNALP